MKKTNSIFNLFLILSLLLINVLPILAQEPTPSVVSEDDIKEKIKERLEKTVEKGLEKVKGVIAEESKSKLYAWVGKIKSISEESLSIETFSGIKETSIASSAAILKVSPGKAKREIKVKDIETEQFIIVMGPKDENQIISGKRVIVLDETPLLPIKKVVISGEIVEIDEKKITIQKNDEKTNLIIDKKVDLKINGIKKPTTEDIQINDYFNAIVTLDKENEIDLIKIVLITPGKTNPQAEENEVTKEEVKESTSTATPSSS